MDFELITLSGSKVNEKVYEVILPTADGEIAVFPDHESLISVAVPGVISVRRDRNTSNDQLEYFAISGGVIEIGNNHLRVLVDEADHGDDIIESESKAALERAMQQRDSATNQVELEKAHQLVDRHAVRLKVASLRRRKQRHL
jgi:F-type H+-transporting ATPase subunit epsilon